MIKLSQHRKNYFRKCVKMSRDFFMTVIKDEDGFFIGNVPSLPGCHTQGRTLEELNANMKEAIALFDE